jgi:hypothetical protein
MFGFRLDEGKRVAPKDSSSRWPPRFHNRCPSWSRR